MADVLARWAAFPVRVETRPLVVIGPLLHESGYVSSEAKNAFGERRLVVAESVPDAAVASLRAELGAFATGPGDAVTVRGAVRVRYPFRTDRGVRELDAWSVEISDALAPVVVVDVAERARMWHAPDGTWGGGTARYLDASGRRLRYRFMGSPQRYTDYDGAETAVSETAVVVSPRAVAKETGDRWRLAYGETRRVDISLHEPLGDRVLVNGSGGPVEVLPTSELPQLRDQL